MKRFIASAIFAILLAGICCAQERFKPSGTYKFATKDGVDLFLDVYDPAPGSSTVLNDVKKPTVLFIFGGGFMMGSRNDRYYDNWFRLLTESGFHVVSIDYRLGLKGVKKMGVAQAGLLEKALDMAVEDLYSATNYLIENGESLGIDPYNMVISGSSAGAITALEAEWHICNSHEISRVLPEGFNYAGVVSFAGAIFSKEGGIRFRKEPAPILMFHGKNDKIVNYNQIWFFNLRFAGSNIITKSLRKADCNYSVFRFDNYGHEISMQMVNQYPEVVKFIYHNIMGKRKRIIDSSVNDPDIRHFKSLSNLSDLYGGDLKSLY